MIIDLVLDVLELPLDLARRVAERIWWSGFGWGVAAGVAGTLALILVFLLLARK